MRMYIPPLLQRRVWAENNTNEVERDREKKEMNEAVMADRGRGMEWYEGLTIFAFVALCVVH